MKKKKITKEKLWEITLNDIFGFTNVCIEAFTTVAEEIFGYVWKVFTTLFWLSTPFLLMLIVWYVGNIIFNWWFGISCPTKGGCP